MTITIQGDLILEKNTEYNESIIVEGDILGKEGIIYNLKVNGNISANDISANDISANDISACDISAWNISYYAVCFAYNSIKCKSIKGRRRNCKQFVLDGEIEIIEKKICEKCGREI